MWELWDFDRTCHGWWLNIRWPFPVAVISVFCQVIGDICLDGSDKMRRFVQSFVLAEQSSMKYYIHNDIFRFEDDIPLQNPSGTPNFLSFSDWFSLVFPF